MDQLHNRFGAVLADDGIPLHYGDLLAEYHAGLNHVILLDRSHEGRIKLEGEDRLALINRMSTHDMLTIPERHGRPTILTNPNARIIDRIEVYPRTGDTALVMTEAGRGNGVLRYLQRNIFFNDAVKVVDETLTTKQFALHGPMADAVINTFVDSSQIGDYGWAEVEVDSVTFLVLRRKAISGKHWAIIASNIQAAQVYQHIVNAGQAHNLQLAGSLTYHTLRIRNGHVARVELSDTYIPLEVGLWDEVSFSKGCYTGQEIIARMESRGRIAKSITAIHSEEACKVPSPIYADGQAIGTLTSSVEAPDGQIFGLGIVKTSHLIEGTAIEIGDTRVAGTIGRLMGAQPPFLMDQHL